MLKMMTAAALVGAVSLGAVSLTTGAAFAQQGPEPPQGAQPMENAGSGSMEKSDGMKKSSMTKSKKSSMMKKKKKAM